MGQMTGKHDLPIDFTYTILNTVFYFTEIGPNSANRVTCFNWDDKCENSVIRTNQTILVGVRIFLTLDFAAIFHIWREFKLATRIKMEYTRVS